jgi:hypothetical protein
MYDLSEFRIVDSIGSEREDRNALVAVTLDCQQSREPPILFTYLSCSTHTEWCWVGILGIFRLLICFGIPNVDALLRLALQGFRQ